MTNHILFIIVTLSAAIFSAKAQSDQAREPIPPIYDKVYRNEWQIDTTRAEQLTFTLNSTLFFRDNEYDTPMMRGYTLPGFRLRPTLDFKPNPYVNVEFGIYLLRFWGTDQYPNMSYSDISYWTGKDNVAKGFHLLPFFRAQMATPNGWNFVLGSIFSGRNHRLIEPLYAPELNLIADPEAGAQILYTNRWLDLDTWVNWESFIYKDDTHQEAFTFGVSSYLKYNKKESPVHLYTPVQILFQHRGGEIDTIYTNSVQTLFNGSVGLGARFDINHRSLKSLTLQADALAFNQQVGDIWPFKHGWAYYAHAHLDMDNLHAKLGYFRSKKFISLFGYPFFGGVSMSNDGLTFDNNSTLLMGVDYSHEFAPGYTLGASAVVFRHFGGTGLLDGNPAHYPGSTSFAGTLYFRLNPTFIIKNFKNKN